MIKEEYIRDTKHTGEFQEILARDITNLLQAFKLVEVDCPACGSAKRKSVFQKERFKFIECGSCKTLYVSPRPGEEALKWFYKEGGAPREITRRVQAKQAERKKVVYTPRARLILSVAEKYLAGIDGITSMEIGGGTGGFSEILRDMKPEWRYMIVEPERLAARLLREKGFEVIEDFVENVDSSKISDLSIALNSELIEHIFDPYKFVQKIHNILRSQGLFILTTPNCHGFDFLAIGKEYKNIEAPMHLNYFNPDSIRMLLERSGFEVLDIRTPGILDVSTVKNHYAKSKNTGNSFLDLLVYEMNDDILHSFQSFLQENRLSGHMLVIARKC